MKSETDQVADYLLELSNQIRAGNLLGLELKWTSGGGSIDSKIIPKKPVEFIQLDFTLGDPNVRSH